MKIKVHIHATDECGNILTLAEALTIRWRDREFTIPAGFESDGVSTPEFLWSAISPAIDPRTIRGGVAHDWIYRMQPEGWKRKDADRMFYDLIREDGLSYWRAEKAYYGLRLFGGRAWRNNFRKS